MTTPHITWIRAGFRYPDLLGQEHDFIAMDGELEVGSVKRIEAGPESGQWFWTMTRVHPGPALDVPRSGTAETRREGARALLECWEAFRKYYGIED